jgi:hypothetical protein
MDMDIQLEIRVNSLISPCLTTGTYARVCGSYRTTNVKIPEFKLIFDHTTYDISSVVDFNKWLERTLKIPYNNGDWLNNAQNNPNVIDLCNKYNQNPADFVSILYKAIRPEKTKLQLIHINDFVRGPYITKDHELWIDSNVVCIRNDIWEQIDQNKRYYFGKKYENT